MKTWSSSTCALILALLACAAWSASGDIPFLTGRVVDNAELLSPQANERSPNGCRRPTPSSKP